MSVITGKRAKSQTAGKQIRDQQNIRSVLVSIAVTLFVGWLAFVFLTPLYELLNASLGTSSREPNQPYGPYVGKIFTYEDKDLSMYKVPVNGQIRELALIEPGRAKSVFIDPSNPTAKIDYPGSYRELDRLWVFKPQFKNYVDAWNNLPNGFARGLLNTFLIAGLSTLGILISSLFTAYGLARFNLPGKDLMLGIVTATLMLPSIVLFVPQYIMFFTVGWVGTWLPLIVPNFFGNAFSIFLLRQFFMAIPREFDEAAKVDGANPLQILWFILMPLLRPAVIAVAIINFIIVWNDFFNPTLYLAGKTELMPLSVLIRAFSSARGSTDPQMISAAAVIATVVPMALFLLAQKPFIRAVTMPGLDK
jgi:multiple sugar transport system permease protein